MMIPDAKVEEVRAASDVVDVVSDYVKLKKGGSNYFGLCPFHNETTPSFSVNPSMGIFKCFGCGAGGDVFRFVMRVEGVGFPEAIRMLAERAGIPLPEQEAEREQASEIESIYHALRFAARFFYEQLTQTEAGQPALEYLTERGFTPKTIKQFGLGYAPDRWDALLQAAEEGHVEPETLEKAGLVLARKDGSGYYDRFRGRVIFPIFSHVGKVLGFGGRILAADSDQPKYINSPETKVYVKSRVLYGLFQGKQAIRQSEFAALVEGYTDVIALHQAGVNNVVATSGTALTREQVKALGRYAKKVVLVYDSDAAGINATLRGADMMFEEGMGAYVVELPSGEDPDSFAREQGGDAFYEYVQDTWMTLPAFKLLLAKRDGKYDTPEGKAETVRSILTSISYIPNPIERDEYVSRIGEALDIPDIYLFPQLDEIIKERGRKYELRSRRNRPGSTSSDFSEEAVEVSSPVPQVSGSDPLPPEKTLIRLMLEHGATMVELILGHMGLDEFTGGPSRTIAELLLEMYQEDDVDPRRFFDGSFSEPVQSLAAEVMMDRYEPSANWQLKQNIPVPRKNEDPRKAAESAMELLKLRRVDAAIARQKEKLYRATQEGRDVQSLQAEMMALHALRRKIDHREFLQTNAT